MVVDPDASLKHAATLQEINLAIASDMEEDRDAVLKDAGKEQRERIGFVHSIWRPMILKLRSID